MKDNNITLTKTEMNDLNAFFEFQLDEEANYLAAFTSKNPNDKIAYIEKYTKFLSDSTITMRTIKLNDAIVWKMMQRLPIGLIKNFGNKELLAKHLKSFCKLN